MHPKASNCNVIIDTKEVFTVYIFQISWSDIQVIAWSVQSIQGNSTETFPACSSLLTTKTTTKKATVTALHYMVVDGGSIGVMWATLTDPGRTVSGARRGTLPSPQERIYMGHS